MEGITRVIEQLEQGYAKFTYGDYIYTWGAIYDDDEERSIMYRCCAFKGNRCVSVLFLKTDGTFVQKLKESVLNVVPFVAANNMTARTYEAVLILKVIFNIDYLRMKKFGLAVGSPEDVPDKMPALPE